MRATKLLFSKVCCTQIHAQKLYSCRLRFTARASHFSIFDLINLHSALLRDVHGLSDSDWHILSDSWWLQRIMRSQEDGVDVFQCSAPGLWSEEVEDDHR